MATVINIGGTSRSGSTMLHLMLGHAPNAFACGEVLNWFRPVKTHHFQINCVCGKNPCPIWESLKSVPEDRFYIVAIKQLQADFLIDSSKELTWLIDTRQWTSVHDIRSLNLFIWKDPLDLAYSFWKRGHGVMFWRSEFVKYYHRVMDVGLPILAVNFNDLTRAPGKKLAEVCKAVGMPYFDGKEKFWKKEHHHLGGSFGVRKQIEVGDSFILPRTTFPPDFEPHINDLQRRIAADVAVQRVIELLRRADVSMMGRNGAVEQEFKPGGPYPLWYYRQKAKRIWFRYFPGTHNLVKAEKVATIPVEQR